MPSNNTKINHFVPKFYLKKFSNEDNNLYIKDLKKGGVHTQSIHNLKSIGSKKNLYTIKNKITKKDMEFIFAHVREYANELHIAVSSDLIKIFETNLKTKIDTDSIKQLVIQLDTDFVIELAMFLNDDLSPLLADLYKCINLSKANRTKLDSYFNNKKIDSKGMSRTQENLFTMYEKNFQKVYEQILKNQNLKFLQNQNSQLSTIKSYMIQKINILRQDSFMAEVNKILSIKEITNLTAYLPKDENLHFDLIYYMINQYVRTKKSIDSMTNEYAKTKKTWENTNDPMLKDLENAEINIKTYVIFIIHYTTLNIVDNLMTSNYTLSLIKNKTDIDFIISDNPCVNTYVPMQRELEQPLKRDEFEMYFPLSPRLALLYSCKPYHDILEITKSNDIKQYNKLVLENSDRYIYSNSENNF